MHRNPTIVAIGLALITASIGCGSSGPRVTLTVGSGLAQGSGASQSGDTLVLTDGTNTLVLSRVALVLREIELERAGHSGCDSSGTGNLCEEFETGPRLIELSFSQGTHPVLVANVTPGTYDRLEFDIHKPDDGAAADRALMEANPDVGRNSIRVEGTFNGSPFAYLTDLDSQQEASLSSPLVVTEGAGDLNLTLQLDVTGWFRTSGAALVDPSTANHGGANEDLVKENIKASIKLFEDHDHDGQDDHLQGS